MLPNRLKTALWWLGTRLTLGFRLESTLGPMDKQRVAVLGIGNPRVGPAIVGAIATYFGEAAIDVAIYDPDPERLELFARFIHVAFKFNKSPHDLTVCEDAEDALDGACKVLIAFDESSAKRVLRMRGMIDVSTPIAEATEAFLDGVVADVLDLTGEAVAIPGRYRLPLPSALTAEELRALPHQILRWVRGEEYLHDFLAEHERSPIRDWLERPESALLG